MERNVRADFSLRDNQTRITNILLDDSQITGGQRLMSVKVSADYNISQNFNLRFFYDQLMTKYKISTAFPLSTVRAGITATFNFGGGQGFSDFFNVGKKFSFPFIVDTPFNSSLQISPWNASK